MNTYDLIKTAAEMAEVALAQDYPTPISIGTGLIYDVGGRHDGVQVHTEHQAEDFEAWAAFLEADQFDYPEDRDADRVARDDNTYAYGTFDGVRVMVFTGTLPKPSVLAGANEVAAS